MQPPFCRASMELQGKGGTGDAFSFPFWTVTQLQSYLPVNKLSDRAEAVAHIESMDVVDRWQAEVQLQGLLPVLPFDLHRNRDALALTLL